MTDDAQPIPPLHRTANDVPGLLVTDEITPHHAAYHEQEKRRLCDELAAKIEKLKKDYEAKFRNKTHDPR